jgi:hypothetical protein
MAEYGKNKLYVSMKIGCWNPLKTVKDGGKRVG